MRQRPRVYVPPVDPGQIPPPSREIYGLMGEANIFRMLEDFYRELERSSLRPLFPEDMTAASRRSAAFFVGLLGGPPLYHQRFGNPMMRARHLAFVITPRAREEWLACFERVLAEAPRRHAFPEQHLPGFRAFLHAFSSWMVNAEDAPSPRDAADAHQRPSPRTPRHLASAIGDPGCAEPSTDPAAAPGVAEDDGGPSPMRTNATKAKLAKGQVVFGAIIGRHAPDLVELFGAIGYDFVMIDGEHGSMSLDDVEHMVRAAEVFGITPIARIPNREDSTVLRFLDRGVQGIIVPHVNTREAADAVARAARYHPEGHRGVAGGRPHDYGVGVSRAQSARWINDQLLVIPMIEETEAVDNLDAILTVPGVDILHVASGDLGQSMGNPGPAAVRQLMRQVVPRIRAAGKLVGVGGNSPADAAGVAEFIRLGANFVTISSLGLLRLGADDFRRRVEAAL